MLHELLRTYLDGVELAISQEPRVYAERYIEEILTPDRVNVRIRLRTEHGYLLEIHEAVIQENEVLVHLDYRYHCQDDQNRLRFNYDSTPHFPNLPTFPHHKHLADGSVISSDQPEIAQTVREALIN
jgi:hypothetical protein